MQMTAAKTPRMNSESLVVVSYSHSIGDEVRRIAVNIDRLPELFVEVLAA